MATILCPCKETRKEKKSYKSNYTLLHYSDFETQLGDAAIGEKEKKNEIKKNKRGNKW